MCRFSEAELYCVKTNILKTSELIQFDIAISTSRYFPPSGTAGFDRCCVSGNKRVPAPPPRITASRLCLAGIPMYANLNSENCREDRRKAVAVSSEMLRKMATTRLE